MSLIWRAELGSTIQDASAEAVRNGCGELIHNGRLFTIDAKLTLKQTDSLEQYTAAIIPIVVPVNAADLKPEKSAPTDRRWSQQRRAADAVTRLLKNKPLTERVQAHLQANGRCAIGGIAGVLGATRDDVEDTLLREKAMFEQDEGGFWGLVTQGAS